MILNGWNQALEKDKSSLPASDTVTSIICTSIYIHLHFTERGSKVYCSLLDAKSAFDSVWHDGLFVKLFKLGINGKMWRLLRLTYNRMYSCVCHDGLMSQWFKLNQSVRQGGVLSAWLYLVYINDLATELEKAELGATIHTFYMGTPMQADDVALLALSVNDMQKMLNICFKYSSRWRYGLNPRKSVVLVFGESPHQNKTLANVRQWWIGDSQIPESNIYKHVGVLLSTSKISSSTRTYEACKKLRNTFISIIGTGLHPREMNPITCKKIYKSICIPRALYGCELWTQISKKEMIMLESAHRFCLKYMQGFHKRTRTDTVYAMLGFPKIETLINERKLLFLRRLCSIPARSRSKQLFTYRLHSYFTTHTSVNSGFIPDIISILNEYEL